MTTPTRALATAMVALMASLPDARTSAAPAPRSPSPSRADYARAQGLRERNQYLTRNVVDGVAWIPRTSRFVYRRSTEGGHEFVAMDATTLAREPAFDHALVAERLSKATGTSVDAGKLPFATFRFVEDGTAIDLAAAGSRWVCAIDQRKDASCRALEEDPLPQGTLRGVWGPIRPAPAPAAASARVSPDGRFEATTENFNVVVREKGAKGGGARLTTDGSEANYYEPASLSWSPDSTKLAAYRIRPGYRRVIPYVQSSPEDQLQPKGYWMQYAKPGDVLDLEQPVVIDVASRAARDVPAALFENPYDLSAFAWRKDSSAFTFEYNARGHRTYRVIEVDARTAMARAVISEEPQSFFYYNAARSDRQSGKRFRFDVGDGREVVWMSERDGWNHLYLIDGATGAVKNQITRGAWAVRGVEKVDEEKRQIYFSAGGMRSDPAKNEDPYFLHYYRIDFDGGNLTPLTTENADHDVDFSPDMAFYVDTYSRVDLPTVSELRKTSDGSLVAVVEKGDASGLMKAGFRPPEPFVAKGRDGSTDIWGLIFRPSTFDPRKKYPVIENIYAGPHGSHVPKNFATSFASQAQAELGFIVVQIDGMGTSNRSKAFHDVAWRNIADAGFPDRILWMKAAAAKYPQMDLSRVGIYGGSAGGQNAMAALLFHGDFYKVAVSYAGCHDNRMDKIWWNEQWMGWPLGPQYSASSNVENAHRLKGKLLLVVGELDTNVDPASTLQVVNALIRAKKTFDFLVVPGENHNAGRGGASGEYGERLRYDFFARHLLGAATPDWNAGTN